MNHRRRSQQIYSLPPLTAREPHRVSSASCSETPLGSIQRNTETKNSGQFKVFKLKIENLCKKSEEDGAAKSPMHEPGVNICLF